MTGSGKTYTIANMIARLGRQPWCLRPTRPWPLSCTPKCASYSPQRGGYFVSYYDLLPARSLHSITRDLFIGKGSSINQHRADAPVDTKSLLERRDTVIVGTVSCIYGIGNPGDYHAIGPCAPATGFPARTGAAGGHAVHPQRRGLHARRLPEVRGETIDIFRRKAELALRLTLFDGEIESLELFDPLTGRVRQKLPRFTVYPGSHYGTPRETVLRAIETIRKNCASVAQLIADGKLVERSGSNNAPASIWKCCRSWAFARGIENYSRHLSGAAPGASHRPP